MKTKKAGFWKRLVAQLIDGLIFWVFGFVVLGIAYETILVSQWDGYTIGKKIMGIRVVSASGHSVGWMQALIRAVSKILSALALFIGFLSALWDKNSQTWHDKLAETYVVDA